MATNASGKKHLALPMSPVLVVGLVPSIAFAGDLASGSIDAQALSDVAVQASDDLSAYNLHFEGVPYDGDYGIYGARNYCAARFWLAI